MNNPPWELDLGFNKVLWILLLLFPYYHSAEIAYCITCFIQIISGEEYPELMEWLSLYVNLAILFIILKIADFDLEHTLGIKWLKARDIGAVLLTAILILIGSSVLGHITEEILNYFHITTPELQKLSVKIGETQSPTKLVLLWMNCAVMSPILEEITFRRTLFELFSKSNVVVAVILISLLFSATHTFLMGFLTIALYGAGFHIVFLKRRNLSTAILLHVIINTISVLATAPSTTLKEVLKLFIH